MTTTETCSIEGRNGIKLDARLFRPNTNTRSLEEDDDDDDHNGDGDDSNKKDEIAVVLVHPYSVLGGCQALMKGIARNLAHLGFPSLIFDMRGVGKSTGTPSLTGFSEVNDVVSVCNWLAQNLSATRIILVGSSAGNFSCSYGLD